MHRKHRFREGWAKAAAIALVAGAIMVPVFAVTAANSQPRDNDPNSIIWGGCYSVSECETNMTNGDGHGHSGANISGIYAMFGIDKAALSSSDTVRGTVYKDGHVTIDQNFGTFKAGDTVATNAWSVGRNFVPGSSPFGSVWKRPEKDVFVANSITGFINMKGGTMNWFVLNSCGNAGKGTPVPAPKPKPSPTPTPSPTPSPSKTPQPTHMSTPTPTMTPTPSPTYTPTPTPTATPRMFSCVSLLVEQDQSDLSLFHFTITPQVSGGVAVTGYLFDFSDQGNVPNQTDANTPTFERELPNGPNTIEGQVETTAGTTDVSPSCTVTLNVQVAPTSPSPTTSPTPVSTGQVLGTQAPLPATGPESALGGVAGLTAIGVAGRAYLRSRKTLMDSLRRKNRK